ncbi:MAG TPA: RsmE family RNA methyltransferase [Anaerohalosphaeraceae bacterium]|nr:RsmE family RNA methyltransferase [Anaerohalosphaeraceae bacterium]HOL32291.1 RsmE family RNA methyltransferase [Anaerohalosphaeraceae bacterium]HOM76887.1 RsmE family RNA methyltransferase [Anaerohalosphaeraceae bacterium]HPC64951.1 RsmE family RNA methyltransferase [Anaerohalosphaeraceae bacterium]HPO69643.1 RsmE family RNA methyltransferase [Anaerohalosphaeraceae bacterium]
MRIPRFFCESIVDESILDLPESAHLCRVLRGKPGTRVELFDGKGTLAAGIVSRIEKKQVYVRIQTIHQIRPRETGRIILAISYAKGQRFDWLVEKCTELGVDHIAAVLFDRTVKLGSPTIAERIDKIAIAASKQCGRLFLPVISGPAGLRESLDFLRTMYANAALLFGDPHGQPLHQNQSDSAGRDFIVLIGPEGGFTETEIEVLQNAGALPVCLNPNILRIETAAAAFCAVLAAGRLSEPAQ